MLVVWWGGEVGRYGGTVYLAVVVRYSLPGSGGEGR